MHKKIIPILVGLLIVVFAVGAAHVAASSGGQKKGPEKGVAPVNTSAQPFVSK